MEWWLVIIIVFGSLILLLAAGLPVAFCFMTLNIIGAYFFWSGTAGLNQLITSMYRSISTFSFLPVPMFVLLGEVLFQSGAAIHAIDVVDKWLGKLPGRISLVAVFSGTLLAALTGASIGAAAMLGSMLMPDMDRRGYKVEMSVGPCMSGGGLAAIIPPSALAVIVATLAELSVGKILIAGVIPGLLMASLYTFYIVGRSILQPHLAPPYVPAAIPLRQKLADTVRHVLPLGVIVFTVTGVIFLGVATPTESAAMGAAASFLLVACYGKLNWPLLKKTMVATLSVTIMFLIILTGAVAFSQILSFTGASAQMVQMAIGGSLNPSLLVGMMMVIVLLMGCFMETVSILMITIPIFFPIIRGLGLDPVWFGLLMLVNVETGLMTPPFGMLIFVMKGVIPSNITMGDIIKSGFPFVICNLIAIGLVIAFPVIALWLPNFVTY
ncbi:MAG: TRAP transporter large permease subunit [Chloroflexota bacterium]